MFLYAPTHVGCAWLRQELEQMRQSVRLMKNSLRFIFFINFSFDTFAVAS